MPFPIGGPLEPSLYLQPFKIYSTQHMLRNERTYEHTNERTNKQTRRIAIPPCGYNKNTKNTETGYNYNYSLKQKQQQNNNNKLWCERTTNPVPVLRVAASRGFSELTKNVTRSSHGHSAPSLKISCKSVQSFSRNLANKETKKDTL